MFAPKELVEAGLAVVGAGYLIHKVYVGVEVVVAKAQAVKAALVTPVKTASK